MNARSIPVTPRVAARTASSRQAAEALGRAPETKERIRKLANDRYSFVTEVLGRELGLSR